MNWASELRPDARSLIAIDGKTSRRSHDRAAGKSALHLVSAFATHEKLVLGQEAVDAKSNEITAIPALLERLAVSGALADADEAAVDRHTDVDKGHGRIEERRCLVSAAIDWMEGERHFPGEYRFPKLAAIAMIESKAETKAGTRTERRFYISSRAMTAKVLGEAVRAHWQIENALHWVLDVIPAIGGEASVRIGPGPGPGPKRGRLYAACALDQL